MNADAVGSFTLGIGNETHDTVCLAVQNLAQALQRIHRDGFVVFQVMDCSGIDAVFIDQGVSSNLLAFHRLPERLIADHGYPLTFQKICLLTFEK